MLSSQEQHYAEMGRNCNNGGLISQHKTIPSVPIGRGRGAAVKMESSNNPGNKSFSCTVCGKGLARKDKLVIHMRIHTGEKPYICEVCNKAFARRDKLVIHMNKMKHRTPTNVAPLGKRTIVPDKSTLILPSDKKSMDVKCDDKLPGGPPIPPPQQNITWTCELCGRMLSSRDEWMAHAKSHLEDKMGSTAPHTQIQQQHITNGNSSTNSVAVPTTMPAAPPAYYPSHMPHHLQGCAVSSNGERHFCLVCRQDFTSKTEFMFHVRTHFEGKIPDFDFLGKGNVVDSSGLCT